MRIEDMVLVSVDDHVVEPPDVFEHHVPAKYKDIAPRVERQPDGTDRWKFLDLDIPNVGLNAVSGRPPEEFGMDPTSFDELRPGTYDVEQRVLDMSANGLLGSLNFPSLPGFAGRLFAALDDKDAGLALCRAYNDWHIEDWCGAAPDRFIPLAIPPIWDPQAIADEVRRVAKKGCHAITFPENPVPLGLPSLHSDSWDPFWQACDDERTIVCMHIGSSSKLAITAMDAPVDVMITLQPMNIVQAAADLIFSPVFRKFPDVTVALSEGGIGWIPYFLERLDHTYLTHKAWTYADFGDQPAERGVPRARHPLLHRGRLRRPPCPRDRHRVASASRPTTRTATRSGPNAPERLMQGFAATDLTDDEIDEITHLNAMRFFQFDPFAIRHARSARSARCGPRPPATTSRSSPRAGGSSTITR